MIAVITSSMRFYYGIAEELKKRGLDFLSLKVGEELPPGVEVVLTTPREKKLIGFPRIVAKDDPGLAVEEAVRLLKGFKEKHGRIIIGIDPGKNPGVAVVAANRATDSFVAPSPQDIKGIVHRILSLHKPREALVRLGSGGGVYRMQVLKSLGEIRGVTVELVDEHSTSKNSSTGPRPDKNAGAALNIALKKGVLLESPIAQGIKPGEIKNIQRDSRAESGDSTISRALARKVAKGELSLEEAIIRHRKRRKERGA